ncbi:site-specific DNA-methyltransferase [Flavobacterium sp. TAB 87]|uniref:site-specific DNA-methyltransferase n=1 Tax=Flavobacterium sp. TAB 87 TaxID=1729581 RepID=UPI00076C84E1|nr:site-specific DNA-methyltransferase [Flavobacterium sp. TAB 87]KVV13414.1 putative methyltransferase [Flavobacterium sp. TAB 87]
MPTLNWIGKEKVINHHQDVPYKILEPQYGFTDGVEQAEPNNSGNKIIHGDNLEALKSLLPEYEGKIKCIYIDPPYNTGNESWVYNDNVNHPKIKKWLGEVVGKDGEDLTRHDKWLCMMYPRLKLLHKLLADDGAIFISIDDNEQANLKLICDEIFGNRNFVTNIIWEKNYSPRNDAKYFSASHDFVIVFAKSKNKWRLNLAPRTEKQNKFYKYNDKDGRGLWRPDNVLVKSFSQSGVFGIKNPNNGKIHFPPQGNCYRFNEEKSKLMLAENKFYFGKDGNGKPQLKRYLSEVNDGVVPQTIWKYDEVSHNQEGKKELNNIIEGNVFDSPKPYQLINRVLELSTDKQSIILDSFAGSGTTAHAVLNLNKQDGGNRKFITIEMEDYADTITAERVKRVIKGYGIPPTPEGGAKSNKWTEGTGGSFDYYELGEPLFLEEDVLNEAVGIENILKYIWYSETRTAFTNIENLEQDNYRIGTKDQTDYYFYYTKQAVTTVDYDFMAKIKHKASQYIIYADNCLLEKDFMLKHHIIFKKIPRDITRF